MRYIDELRRSMNWLAEQEDTIFIGQGVVDGGVFMSSTLDDVPVTKKIEWPVTEAMQMGASIGIATAGYTCISLFPRHNFLLLGLSELVNWLDKMPEIAGVQPKVIIRTAVGTTRPIYPGIQHSGDFTEAFKKLLSTIEIIELKEPEQIFEAYQHAYHKQGATLISEIGDFYAEK